MNKKVTEFFASHPEATVCFLALGYVFADLGKAEAFCGGVNGQKPATFTREEVEAAEKAAVAPAAAEEAPVEEVKEEAVAPAVTEEAPVEEVKEELKEEAPAAETPAAEEPKEQAAEEKPAKKKK